MRIITKTSLSEEESEFDGKSLNKEQMQAPWNITKPVRNHAERVS